MQNVECSKKSCVLQEKQRKTDSRLENEIIRIFKSSSNNYGSRKIKKELIMFGIIASRRKIRQVMKKYNLVSNYTVKQFKVQKIGCNNDKIDNVVNREFNKRNNLEVVVSDLTYVRSLTNGATFAF